MKLPTGAPVFQHQFNVTFNDQPVEGLTDWIGDVSLDYIEKKIGLSFMLVHDSDPANTLSHQKLQALFANKDLTMEVYILSPSNDVVCKEIFHNLKLAELFYGLNSRLETGDNSTVVDLEEEDLDDDEKSDTSPRSAACLFDNPVHVSASITYGAN